MPLILILNFILNHHTPIYSSSKFSLWAFLRDNLFFLDTDATKKLMLPKKVCLTFFFKVCLIRDGCLNTVETSTKIEVQKDSTCFFFKSWFTKMFLCNLYYNRALKLNHEPRHGSKLAAETFLFCRESQHRLKVTYLETSGNTQNSLFWQFDSFDQNGIQWDSSLLSRDPPETESHMFRDVKPPDKKHLKVLTWIKIVLAMLRLSYFVC